MENLRPNEQRASTAIILIWVVLAAEILSLVSGYFQYELLTSAANGASISPETATANDSREQLVAILYLIVLIISAVTFIQWFRRAYYNLHLKVQHLSHTEGWAAGAWFTPVISLFRPYQIMKELYEETKKLLLKRGDGSYEDFTTNILGWWWALWIINNIMGQFVFRYSKSAETIDELITATTAGMVANVIGIPLAFLAVKVIKDYAKVEPLLNDTKGDFETNATGTSF